MIRPFITREAVLSSKIEGTQATIGEILAANVGVSVKRNPEDLQEVQNYIVALDYGIKRLDSLPFSLRLIKELHHHLRFIPHFAITSLRRSIHFWMAMDALVDC